MFYLPRLQHSTSYGSQAVPRRCGYLSNEISGVMSNLGRLSTVTPGALPRCWSALTKNTKLGASRREGPYNLLTFTSGTVLQAPNRPRSKADLTEGTMCIHASKGMDPLM